MSEIFGKSAPAKGQLTAHRCVRCGEQKVLQVYERFSSRVLFCISCEHVWTNEPGGTAEPGSGRT